MKKIQERVKKVRKILILTSVMTASAVFLPGCDLFAYKRPFPDAYYENNFIEGIGFDQFAGADATVPAEPVTGMWDFAYRYTDWDGYDYMTRTSAGVAGDYPSVPSGLSATAPVYRLKLVNLISGGDFEGVSIPVADWTKDNVLFPNDSSWTILNGTVAGAINNDSLSFNLTKDTHFIQYNMNLPSTFISDQGYEIDFKWILKDGNYDMVSLNTIDGSAPVNFSSNNTAESRFIRLASNFLYFGSTSSGLELTIDDITVKKTIPAQLRLLLKISDTNPPLESLLYRFSFWVYEDPSVGAYTSPYHLDTLKADMQPVLDNSTLSKISVPEKYEYNSSSTGWKKMTVEVNNGNLQFIGADPAKPVLELIIDLDESLPGQVLIAQPELRCYPDGY